jgi:hypothetical protein
MHIRHVRSIAVWHVKAIIPALWSDHSGTLRRPFQHVTTITVRHVTIITVRHVTTITLRHVTTVTVSTVITQTLLYCQNLTNRKT